MTVCSGQFELDSTLLGTDGDDILSGGCLTDLIHGGSGNDILVGSVGQDTLFGGDDDDVLVGGGLTSDFWDVETVLSEEEEIAALVQAGDDPHPSTSSDILVGGAGDDLLIGGSWDDQNGDGIAQSGEVNTGSSNVSGFAGGNNILWGGSGHDELYGANGLDTLGGGSGNDLLSGYGGVDVIFGGTGDDTIYGGEGDPDFFFRGDGNSFTLTEELYGGGGNDFIFGEGDVDRIYGGDGDDRINGGDGADTLTGGAGADSFIYPQDTARDIVTDFDVSEDQLVFLDRGQAAADSYISAATEQTINGVTGLLIQGAGGEVFLVGLSESDIANITAVSEA